MNKEVFLKIAEALQRTCRGFVLPYFDKEGETVNQELLYKDQNFLISLGKLLGFIEAGCEMGIISQKDIDALSQIKETTPVESSPSAPPSAFKGFIEGLDLKGI